MNHSLTWALLVLTPFAVWRTKWAYPCLLPMLVFSMFSGWALLETQWDVVYNPATIGFTVACQTVASIEAGWFLARCERSRPEASLILGFAALVAASLVLSFAAANPQPYPNMNAGLYFTRTGAHIGMVGFLGSIMAYHFASRGALCRPVWHTAILFCYLFVNVASHALKDPSGWLNRNALQLGVHVAAILAWIVVRWEQRDKPSLIPAQR